MTVFCRCPDSSARMIILGHLALTYAGLPRSVAMIGCCGIPGDAGYAASSPGGSKKGLFSSPFRSFRGLF
jgi:hypothetical protein